MARDPPGSRPGRSPSRRPSGCPARPSADICVGRVRRPSRSDSGPRSPSGRPPPRRRPRPPARSARRPRAGAAPRGLVLVQQVVELLGHLGTGRVEHAAKAFAARDGVVVRGRPGSRTAGTRPGPCRPSASCVELVAWRPRAGRRSGTGSPRRSRFVVGASASPIVDAVVAVAPGRARRRLAPGVAQALDQEAATDDDHAGADDDADRSCRMRGGAPGRSCSARTAAARAARSAGLVALRHQLPLIGLAVGDGPAEQDSSPVTSVARPPDDEPRARAAAGRRRGRSPTGTSTARPRRAPPPPKQPQSISMPARPGRRDTDDEGDEQQRPRAPPHAARQQAEHQADADDDLDHGQQRAHRRHDRLGQQLVGAYGRTLSAGSGSLRAPATIQTPPVTSRASRPNHCFTPPTLGRAPEAPPERRPPE